MERTLRNGRHHLEPSTIPCEFYSNDGKPNTLDKVPGTDNEICIRYKYLKYVYYYINIWRSAHRNNSSVSKHNFSDTNSISVLPISVLPSVGITFHWMK